LLNALLLAPYIASTGKELFQVEGIKRYRNRAAGQSILLRKAITKYGGVRGRDDGRFLAA
jgi:predicted component of type VI protein secretion system